MRVDQRALDVLQVGVVLQRAHVEPGLLAELRDARAVVVREGVVGEDGVGDLGVGDEVDLQELGLEGGLLGLVAWVGWGDGCSWLV